MSIPRIFWFFVASAFFFNFLQAGVHWNAYNFSNSKNMVEWFIAADAKQFDTFFFANSCEAQFSAAEKFIKKIDLRKSSGNDLVLYSVKKDGSDQRVFSAANPVLFAEIAVLTLVGALVGIVVFNRSGERLSRFDVKVGVAVGVILLLSDQARYIYTSVLVDNKFLFTWSSYCFHGDLGWAFDVAGYFFMYAVVALGVAVFSQAIRHFRYDEIDVYLPKMGQPKSVDMVCRVYTWLPYFSYAGFAVWVACTQINSSASQYYGGQAVLVTGILVAVWAVCCWALYRASQIYDEHLLVLSVEDTQRALENPVKEFLDPFGVKAMNTLIRIVLPLLTLLALWYKVVAALLSFG